jgi:hypothetical protein
MFKRRLAAVLSALMLASIAMGAITGPTFAAAGGEDTHLTNPHHK